MKGVIGLNNQIGFIGLGIMGVPMVRNLLEQGQNVMVFNRNKEKYQSLRDYASIQIANDPAQVMETSEVVILMVSDDRAVEEVILGDKGLVLKALPNQIVVVCSTIHPDTVKKIAATPRDKGVQVLDAPVTGSKPQAENGTLSFIVGGDKNTYENACPFYT